VLVFVPAAGPAHEFFGHHARMKTQTIEIDDDTAKALEQRAKQRGVTVRELVAELVTLEGD
jgi:hypothetical protein